MEHANRGGYPPASSVQRWIAQQGRPIQSSEASLTAYAGATARRSRPEPWLAVAPTLSALPTLSRQSSNSISWLHLPAPSNRRDSFALDAAFILHSSRSSLESDPQRDHDTYSPVLALDDGIPLFCTFFRFSSASSLGPIPTADGLWELEHRPGHALPEHAPDNHDSRAHDADIVLAPQRPDRTDMAPISSTNLAAPSLHGAESRSSTGNMEPAMRGFTNDGTDAWRPRSARSTRSARPPKPLFARWTRRQQARSRDMHADLSGTVSREGRSRSQGSQSRTGPGHVTRAVSISKRRQTPSPQLTREEFETLPLAIQRKYFSTLERLRFAQESGAVDGISRHYDDISAQNAERCRPRQDLSASDHLTERLRRGSFQRSHLFSTPDAGQSLGFPEKIQRSHFSREEQLHLAKQLRASVILDAADEALFKAGRRASRYLEPDLDLSPTSSLRSSMEMDKSVSVPAADSIYDSFRWLDDEEDLDLRLFLDDYHVSLREEVPLPTKERRPSFRRHLSISKIPFGRSSISSSRPPTNDASYPVQTIPKDAAPSAAVGRRKSRALSLSLITPRHVPHDSVATIDPSAAHYQDPEARLKLRVYLASPQKFDEAIEFGFPSTDVLTGPLSVAHDTRPLRTRLSRRKISDDPSMRTFLADDDEDDDDSASLYSDASLVDPDSPRTPQYFESKPARPMPVENYHAKASEGGYAQAPTSSREMTLRMTLTRPDLRSNEDALYGWQHKTAVHKSLGSLSGAEQMPTYMGENQHKESTEKVFSGMDPWGASQPDKNVMKRFWNRVRRT